MGNLRDELKKAGLLNEKDIRRVHQEEQQRKKVLGKEGVADEEQKKKAEAEARARAQAEKDRELARRQQAERERKEAIARFKATVDAALLRDFGGPRRFHFVTRHDVIVSLEVAPEIARRLEGGELAIIEKPTDGPVESGCEEHGIVPRDLAKRLAETDREAVRFLNGV